MKLSFISRFNLLSKSLRFFILLYLAIFIGGGVFLYKAWEFNSEFGACIDIYNDPALSPEIRAHCTKIVEGWQANRDAEEAKEKQDYIENFGK